MPIECVLTLKTEGYSQGLAAAVTDTKRAAAELSGSTAQAAGEIKQAATQAAADTAEAGKQAASQVADAATKAAGQASQAVAKVGKSGAAAKGVDTLKDKINQMSQGVGKAGPMVGALGSAFSAMGPKLSAVGALLSSAIMGPIGMITAGLGVAVAFVVKIWDKLTLSSDEYAAKLAKMSEAADRAKAKIDEQATVTKELVQRLRELKNETDLSNIGRLETAKILELLTRKYGDLGAQVDATTGQLQNYAEVEERIRMAEAGKQVKALEQKQAIARKEYELMFKQGGLLSDKKTATYKVGGREFTNTIESDVKPATARQDLERLLGGAKTQKEIENLSAALAKFDEISARDTEIASYKKDGYSNDAERIAAERARAAEDDQRRNRLAALGTAEGYDPKLLKKNQTALQGVRQVIKATAKDDSDEGIARFIAARETEARLLNEIDALEKGRIATVAKLNEQNRFEIQYQKLILAGEFKKADALKVENELKQRGIELTPEEKARQQADRDTLGKIEFAKQVTSANDDIALQKLLVAGKLDEYRLEKLIVQAKRDGKELTDAQLATLEKQAQAQGALALKGKLKGQTLDLYGQAATQAGLGQQWAEAKALKDARDTKGGDLTKEESALVRQLAQLSFEMSNSRGMQLGDVGIKSNSLTARGGFAGGAKVPDSGKINREIANTSKQSASTLQTIQRILDKLVQD